MAARGKFILACLLWSACAATPALAFVMSDAIAELRSTRLETGGTQAQALTILDYVVRPRLITSSPADGAASEPPIFAVTLNLSAPTAPGNVTAGSVQLEAGGVVVTADLDLSDDGDTITITPDGPFIDDIFLNVIASVAVRALLDEDTLVDPLGFPIDVDGDGVAGGQGVLAFNTARLVRYEGTVLAKTLSIANSFQPPLAILPVGDGVNFAASAPVVSVFNEVQPTVDDLPGSPDSVLDGFASALRPTIKNSVQPDVTDLPGALIDGFATAPYFTIDNAVMMMAATFKSCDYDADSDGLPGCAEARLGLNPVKADSDGNGVADGDEDFDGDGVPNADEWIEGTLFGEAPPAAASARGIFGEGVGNGTRRR